MLFGNARDSLVVWVLAAWFAFTNVIGQCFFAERSALELGSLHGGFTLTLLAMTAAIFAQYRLPGKMEKDVVKSLFLVPEACSP
jgi:hypothetical protein